MMIDTIKYYPPHIRNIEEFKRIAEVYDQKLQLVWEHLDKMRSNRRFDQMDEAECEYWEKILRIKLTGEETLDDRRRNVKGIWASGLPYTERKFAEVLDAMVGPESPFDGYQQEGQDAKGRSDARCNHEERLHLQPHAGDGAG